jgi:hypothetical protein
MPTALKLDYRKPVTYKSVLKKDANIISQVAYLKAAMELYQSLWDQTPVLFIQRIYGFVANPLNTILSRKC